MHIVPTGNEHKQLLNEMEQWFRQSVKQLEDRACNSEIHKPILLKGCTKQPTKALRYMLKNKLQTRCPDTHQQPNHTQMGRWSFDRDPTQA